MKKIMTILSIIILGGAVAATYAFAVSDTVTVSANVTQVPSTEVTIAIKEGPLATATDLLTLSLGAVPNTATNYRMGTSDTTYTGKVPYVHYFVGAGTHEIRTWFDNFPTLISDPNKAVAGLKTVVGTTTYYWPLKVWSGNYGPTNATKGADPDNATYWNDNYGWILEKAYKVDGFGKVTLTGYPQDDPLTTTVDEGIYKDETRTKLAWYYPTGTAKRPNLDGTISLNAKLDSGFRVDLAISAMDAQYATSTATTYAAIWVIDLTQTP